MKITQHLSWKDWLKGGLCGLAYPLGLVVGGMLIALMRMPQPPAPPGAADPARLLRAVVFASVLVGLSLVPLACGLAGSLRARWLSLAALLYLCLGVNTLIEARIFTTLYAHGGALSTAIIFFPAALLCAAALGYFLAPAAADSGFAAAFGSFLGARKSGSWMVRFALAILAFPVAYFLFGMMVAPIVKDVYLAGIAGLTIPPMGVILRTQLLRSLLFLLASLSVMILWRGSRLRLALALGLAHTVLVGLFGLTQAYWMPMLLRVVHSVEITADSFLYAFALVFLLAPRPRKDVTEGEVAAAA